jgi:probable phosphoglycerate mutase
MVLELLTGAVRRTGGPVLAVTHSGVIGTMVRLVINSDLLTLKVFNGSITALEWREGHWQLRFLNLWDHLPYELRT